MDGPLSVHQNSSQDIAQKCWLVYILSKVFRYIENQIDVCWVDNLAKSYRKRLKLGKFYSFDGDKLVE